MTNEQLPVPDLFALKLDGYIIGGGEIADIIGKTPVSIVAMKNADGEDQIRFLFTDGSVAVFYHSQDCCESVSLEDVNGDWKDLIGNPLLVAEERTEEKDTDYGDEQFTFYTFRGIGGSVDVRWHGESNGYYSISVDFVLLPPDRLQWN